MKHLVQEIQAGRCQDDLPSSFSSSTTSDMIVLTGDQVVTCNGKILEKPESIEEARSFVQQYGHTPPSTVGSCVLTHLPSGIQVSGVDTATIYFQPDTPGTLVDQLVAQNEPVLSCAGGLMVEHPNVQAYVQRIDGTQDSVMGLSKDLVLRLLDELQHKLSTWKEQQQQQQESGDDGMSTSEGLSDIGQATTISKDNTSNDNDSMINKSSWRQLLEISSNRSRKIRGSNYVQLATVENGMPRCRTVVFRGFLPNVPSEHSWKGNDTCDNMPCIMKMITDARSNKVQQINNASGAAEMVWWFPKSSEQYRIRGQLVLVGPPEEEQETDEFLQKMRREQWGNLSDSAREAFYDPLVPGFPWRSDLSSMRTSVPIPAGGRDAMTGKVVQPPPQDFLLMLLRPQYCDYLRLGSEQYRQIDELQSNGTWTSQRVNP
jgi:septum formation protein